MSIISVISAKGSPGVTTAVVAMALGWTSAHPHRSALVVDADPIGGDTAAGVLRGELPAGSGVLALATSRTSDAREAVDRAAVPLSDDGRARVIPGVPDGARSPALSLAWAVVADQREALHADGLDVLVDAGRATIPPSSVTGSHAVGTLAQASPWLADSDIAVVVVRPGLPGVLATHRLADDWTLIGVPLHVLVLDSPSPYRASEVADAVGLPLLGALPYDAASARVFSDGAPAPRGFGRNAYVRGVRRVAEDLGLLAIERADTRLPAPSWTSPAPSPSNADLRGAL